MGQLWMEITVLRGADFDGIQHDGACPQLIPIAMGAVDNAAALALGQTCYCWQIILHADCQYKPSRIDHAGVDSKDKTQLAARC